MLVSHLLKTKNSRYIYQNELDNVYFQHLGYENFKNLPGRTVTDKVLSNKEFNIAKIWTRYQRGLISMVYNFFDKNSSGGAVTPVDKYAISSEISSNQLIAQANY